MADIVAAARQGRRKTKIMYLANLSHCLLKKYLQAAVQVGFVRVTDERYIVTENGQRFLETYMQYYNKYSGIQKLINTMRFEWQNLEELCRNGYSWDSKRRNGAYVEGGF
jgi:predicted transcriptional regulator